MNEGRYFDRALRTGMMFALAVFLPACAEPPAAASVTHAGQVALAAIDESSGLAASRRSADLLWTLNDSDGEPVLYALGTDGKQRGSVRIAGVKNIDWEDLASFELDGRAWLLVADVGDNGARRKNCVLHIVAEPDPAELSPERELSVSVSWSIPVVYPDGPNDCESVAVDVREGRIYLLRKRTHPNPLFILPLRPAAPAVTPPAREVARVRHVPQPNSEQRAFPVPTGRYRGNPTAMDISADGFRAAVLTYGDVLLFQRRPGETWDKAFSRPPVLLPPHGFEQAEALCFSADGRSLFVTEEKIHTALLRYDLPPLSIP